jgi:hypothetical protein
MGAVAMKDEIAGDEITEAALPPKPCCFVARLAGLEPEQETRFKAWAKPRCREFRVLPPVGGVTVVCGILLQPPAKVRGFHSLWITNLKTWKVKPGPVYLHGKLRLLPLDEYHAEMGTSPAVLGVCTAIVDNILSEFFFKRVAKAAFLVEMDRQNVINHEKFLAGQKRLREEEEALEVARAKIAKRAQFFDERNRVGDDLDGKFRPEPPFAPCNPLAPYHWVSEEELLLDDWHQVLAHREAERSQALGHAPLDFGSDEL